MDIANRSDQQNRNKLLDFIYYQAAHCPGFMETP
jgi:hypothetical protein